MMAIAITKMIENIRLIFKLPPVFTIAYLT
jgi:hypothetical protein